MKVIDQQRRLHFRKTYNDEPPNLEYVFDKKLKSKYTYKQYKSGTFNRAKKMKELVPAEYKENPSGFALMLENSFKAKLGLNK